MVSLLNAVAVAFVAGLVVTLAEAIRRGNGAATVNAAVALAVALVPGAVEALLVHRAAPSVGFSPELTLWLALAGFLHSLGMLGLYESVWWWDHLTHLLSGALVAALLYAGFTVLEESGTYGFTAPTIAALTVGMTFAGGVFWELIELVARELGDRLDVEPVLVHYGWRDTGLDLIFDAVAAALVVLLDVRLFVGLAERFPRATRTLLFASAGIFVLGSTLLALGLHLAGTADSAY